MGRNVKWNNLFLLGEDEIFFSRERERERIENFVDGLVNFNRVESESWLTNESNDWLFLTSVEFYKCIYASSIESDLSL